MKIDDNLEILNNELPEVFEGSKLPELWEEWIFLPNDKEDDIHPIFQSPDVNESFSPYDDTQISLENWYNYSGRLIVFPSDSKGKDGPVSEWDANCLPPVDALGFYLPYHYYYPVWWGIYLLADGVESLSNFLMTCANGGISKNDAVKAAKLFIYYHEYYHHLVESFATKLEVILREPIFKTGFKKTKKAYKALDRCKDGLVSEESLASAYSFRKTIRHFNDNKKVQKLISNSLIRYIKDQPLCYREAIEYIGQKEFIAGQCEMIDDFYCVSTGIESQKIKDVMLWTNFPYALSGSTKITSKVKYIVHKNSLIAQRVTLNIDYFKYKEVIKKLRKITQCEFISQKGSHEKWKCNNGNKFIIPRHPGDLKRGTLKSILKQTGTDIDIRKFVTI